MARLGSLLGSHTSLHFLLTWYHGTLNHAKNTPIRVTNGIPRQVILLKALMIA